MARFKVLRQHKGDRLYHAGEVREADRNDVAHLVRSGVLAEVKIKAEPKAENKAEPKASNKAARK